KKKKKKGSLSICTLQKKKKKKLVIVCAALKVSGLGSIFVGGQTLSHFSALPFPEYESEGRRMWSNGRGVRVYLSKRWFPQVGVWVISNDTLSVVQNVTQFTNDAPGTSDGTYGLWDHFINDNIYEPLLYSITLRMTCLSVFIFLLALGDKQTIFVIHYSKKKKNKTKVCTTLQLIHKQSTCPAEVASRMAGYFTKQDATVNGKIHFSGVDTTRGSNIFWSDLYKTWVIDGTSSVGYSALSLVDIPSDFPPQLSSWTLVEQNDIFNLDCEITFQFSCSSY
ncbi:hypothetical protein RFI_10881, partial [Reticulomyxa filosa]